MLKKSTIDQCKLIQACCDCGKLVDDFAAATELENDKFKFDSSMTAM